MTVPKGKDQEQAQEGTSGKGSEFDPLSAQDECSEDSEKTVPSDRAPDKSEALSTTKGKS
jgi:hypothetical protein